jgi:phosphoglycerate dehydrogenase-like enzyme
MAVSPRPSREPLVAVEPECWRRPALAAAVEAGGGRVVPTADATALVWADPARPDLLPETVHDAIDWVQLPYAGVEPFLHLLDDRRIWTCGKGVYARPVAEHVLGLVLAGFRNIGAYARARSWSEPVGRNLHGARILVLGAGGILDELVPLLAPFGCHLTVLRRTPDPVPGVDVVATLAELGDHLPDADVVVLALALTDETVGVIDAAALDAMRSDAWLVNVARGRHVDTDALVAALESGAIGGAALDVTDPEPLPDGHRLWSLDNAIVTPHIANTPEMGLTLLAERVSDNVARYAAGTALVGPVDLTLGY